MSVEKDKLYEFLSVLCLRLIGAGGPKIRVKRSEGTLVVDLPFNLAVVYGVSTALHDAGEVDFSMVITITTKRKEKPTVRVLVRPQIQSWVWKAFGEETETSLENLVVFYKCQIEKSPIRTAVLART